MDVCPVSLEQGWQCVECQGKQSHQAGHDQVYRGILCLLAVDAMHQATMKHAGIALCCANPERYLSGARCLLEPLQAAFARFDVRQQRRLGFSI
jgi:hypothetical protein